MPTTSNSPLITLEDVLDALAANLPKLEHNQLYSLEQLVGKERWLATPTGHRKQLGTEFKQLVLNSDTPVRWVDRGLDNSQLYELK